MLRSKIKKELDQRGWSALKLSQETGIRYPSISEYLAEKKELNSFNIEKILTTLNLEIMSQNEPKDAIGRYTEMLTRFDGANLPKREDTREDYFASYLLGGLVRKAFNYLQSEVSISLNYGDAYSRFVSEIVIDREKVVDIPTSLIKREFVRIINKYFTESEKQLVAALLLYEYPEDSNRGNCTTQFVCGLMSDMEI